MSKLKLNSIAKDYILNVIENVHSDNIKVLSEKGQQLIEKAYETAHTTWINGQKDDPTKYGDITYNLRDSYGYGVYLEGKLIKEGYLSGVKAQTMSLSTDEYGRDKVKSFLYEYKSTQKGYTLVICAAISYANDLEDGDTYSGNSYKVISQIGDDLESFATQVKGTVRRLKDYS